MLWATAGGVILLIIGGLLGIVSITSFVFACKDRDNGELLAYGGAMLGGCAILIIFGGLYLVAGNFSVPIMGR